MNAVIRSIPELVRKELEAANAKHPRFNSAHEGYAVLLEETEELIEEVEDVRTALPELWNDVRCDDAKGARYTAMQIEEGAVRAAAEAIQVAAMVRKFRAIGEKTDVEGDV